MHYFEIQNNWRLTKVEQIAQAIKSDIKKGLLKKDHQLPSINKFSRQYLVARDTVEKAYQILKNEGYVSSVKGKGYFVIF